MAPVSVENLRTYADLNDDVDGTLLQGFIDAATQFLSDACGRQFAPEPALENTGTEEDPVYEDTADPVTKLFSTRGYFSLRIPDLREATEVLYAGSEITEATPGSYGGYSLVPTAPPHVAIEVNPRSLSPNWLGTPGIYDVQITGRWGYLDAPADVRDSILFLASRRFRERDAAFGDAIQLPEGSAVMYFREMPSYVEGVVRHYRIPQLRIA